MRSHPRCRLSAHGPKHCADLCSLRPIGPAPCVTEFTENPFRDIPRSVQNPKILGRDDTEVIRYLITIDTPFSGHLLAQKGQSCGFEVSKCRMTSIVGDMLVHQSP